MNMYFLILSDRTSLMYIHETKEGF